MPAVLVVDDSAVARLTVTRRLRAEGLEVVELESATLPEAETVARLACALLDLDLGDANGCDLARLLRARRSELPIAFFSGTVSRELLERATSMGPVFAKPAELDAAVAWVRRAALP